MPCSLDFCMSGKTTVTSETQEKNTAYMLFARHWIWPLEHNILVIQNIWQSSEAQSAFFPPHRRNINASAEAFSGYMIIVQDSTAATCFWPLNLFLLGSAFWYCQSTNWCPLKEKIFLFSCICQSVHLSSLCYYVIKCDSQIASDWRKKKSLSSSSQKGGAYVILAAISQFSTGF